MTSQYLTESEQRVARVFSFLFFTALIFGFIYCFHIGMQREERRQEIVQQSHCEHYGPSIAKWAADKGIKNPCD